MGFGFCEGCFNLANASVKDLVKIMQLFYVQFAL